MLKTVTISALFSLALAMEVQAAPAAPPPPSPPYGAPISLAQAKQVATAADAELKRRKMDGAVIAVVQPDGSLVYFEKMDKASYVSNEFALAKARTAAITLHATGGFGPGMSAPPLPDLVGLPGGVPIVIGGKTVGAIGVSGAEGVDGAIAEAAASSAR
ncbi:MAG: heme-binding protein [Pseudomonadota bacterium]|nr:heme-binding protein [Pseudomonadota bacterium]